MTAYMDHKNLANEVIDDARAREITDGVHRVLDRIAAAENKPDAKPAPCACWPPRRRATSAKSWLRLMPACA